MKRLLFLAILIGTTCSIWAQVEENIFEWGTNNTIIVKDKFLGLYRDFNLGNKSPYFLKEYDVSSNVNDIYKLKMMSVDDGEIAKNMLELGTSDFFEIHYKGDKILGYFVSEYLYNVESITMDADQSPFIKVPLSENSFALFFGGWPYDGSDAPELVIAVVSNGVAKVVYDNRALAYKYTPAPDFCIEFVENIGTIYEKHPLEFTESFLKGRTKYKIWREGNMLKYKSWK